MDRDSGTTAKTPGMFSVVVTGVLIVGFAIQLFGVIVGSLPADASGQSRLVFGAVMVVGLVASTASFISLYRRAYGDRGDGDDAEHITSGR